MRRPPAAVSVPGPVQYCFEDARLPLPLHAAERPPPPTIEFDTRFDKSRAIDGNEACWFVWKIEPDEGGLAAVVEPAPARLVPA